MQLPQWLIHATGAQSFANNPLNGFTPTIGDALQGIGHSMMEHYRRGHADGQAAAGGNQANILGQLPPLEKLALHFNTDGTPAPAGTQGAATVAPPPITPVAQPAMPTPVPNFTDPSIISKILAGGQGPQVGMPSMPVGQALQMFK